MTEKEIADWYEGSVCALCGKETCNGECPGYEEFERSVIEEEYRTGVFAPVIPCRPITTMEVATQTGLAG